MLGKFFSKKPKTAAERKEAAEKKREQSVNKQTDQMMQMSADFEKSKVESALSQAKSWKKGFFGSLAVSALAVGAVMGLTPLKEAVPFVQRVNDTTGAVDIITTVKNKEMHYDEVINKYWLSQYVRYRESYDWDLIQATYDATTLMSSPAVKSEFTAFYNQPNAPHKVLKQNFKIVSKVTNIAFVGDMAQVRFTKQTLPASGQSTDPIPPQKMIATIGFKFTSTPMSEEDRTINPLGFEVTSYRVDPETTQ